MALHSPPALQHALRNFEQRGDARYLIGSAIIAGAIAVAGSAAIPVILTAATIGAGMSYGFQVYDNYQSGLRGPELWRANLSVGALAEGAFLGAVSGATAALVGAYLPAAGVGGWQGTFITAGTEVITGRASQVAANVVAGRPWDEDLWNRRDIALDVLPGVSAGPLLRGAKWGLGKARGGVRQVRQAAGRLADLGQAGVSRLGLRGELNDAIPSSEIRRTSNSINQNPSTEGTPNNPSHLEILPIDKTDQIYRAVEGTEYGKYILDLADKQGNRPQIAINASARTGEWGGYIPKTHIIDLNPVFRQLPPEVAAVTVSHELVHRYARWLTSSQKQEIVAHTIEALVWREIKARNIVDISNLTPPQSNLLQSFDRVLGVMEEATLIRTKTNEDPQLPWYDYFEGLSYSRLSVQSEDTIEFLKQMVEKYPEFEYYKRDLDFALQNP